MWALALAAVVLTSCVVLLRRSKTKAARRPSDTLKETVETLAEEIEKPQLKCAMCGMDDGHVYGGLRRCGRCKTTWYCTAECQRAHWPAHRCNCEAIAARGGLSTFFLVGFPDRSGPPPPGEPVLGLAALEALVAACLKPDGLVCVATASSPRGGHPARAAVETLASGDYEVLRAGAGAAVGMPHKIYDLRFYGTSKDLELSALAAEAKMLMEMGAIKPSPGDETTAYSALDAEDTRAPFSVNDPPPEAVASAMNYLTQMPWPRVFVDGALNSPFWLLKRDPDAAAQGGVRP